MQHKTHELERRVQRLEETCGELNRKYFNLLRTVTQLQKRCSNN